MPTIAPTYPADGDDAIVGPYNAAIALIVGVLNGNIDADNIAAGAVGLSELSSVVAAALNPTGSILAYGGGSAPTGYLMCDGSSQLRASYSALFAIVGTSFGTVDGTHFNLPDLRGRVPVGADAMSGTAANRSQHSTTITTSGTSTSATVASAAGLSIGMFITSTNITPGTTITAISGTTLTMSAGSITTGSTVAARFSLLGNDAQTVGSVGGVDTQTLVTAQMPSHTHSVLSTTTTAGGSGAAIFTPSGSTNTGSAGNDQAHPNVQPSVVVNYIIKT